MWRGIDNLVEDSKQVKENNIEMEFGVLFKRAQGIEQDLLATLIDS
jgi:hypothetical protein